MIDDIPVALREGDNSNKNKSPGIPINHKMMMIIGVTGIAIMGLLFLLLNRNPSSQVNNPTEVETTENTNTPVNENPNTPTNSETSIPDNILGHLPYEEAPQNELKAITKDGSIKMREKAADKFLQMQRDAQAQGIILTPISGFRSIKDQEYLFFKVKEQRKQDTSKRAEVSAPPGYSEHHTGYAIDIGDGNAPATNLNTKFEKTPAYQWLRQNAAKYSFELSFTPDNLQGISYEPWHWRFVGDTHSLETFYKARHLTNNIQAK